MSKRNYRSHGQRYWYIAHVQSLCRMGLGFASFLLGEYHARNSSVSDTGTHMYRAAGHAHRVQRVRQVRSEVDHAGLRMPTRRPKLLVLLALALTVPLLLGCASVTPDPIRLGRAPAEPTGKINLDLPVDPSGYLEFSRWPNACDLLTDRDLRAVFPQAEDIERQSEDRTMTVYDLTSSTDSDRPAREVTVKNATCDVMFSLPGARRDYSDGYELTVAIDAAGTEEFVRPFVREGASPPKLREGQSRASLGGADCIFRRSLRTSCFKGRLSFHLSTEPIDQLDNNAAPYNWEVPHDGPRVRYQVGTKVTTFELDKTSLETLTKFENEHIRSELVKAVASKL